MRCTQYIGLTADASYFVKDMEVFPQLPNTLGMFDEDVPLSLFLDSKGNVFIEDLDVCPWSSGPMIFTCLIDQRDGRKLFQWRIGSLEDREYNLSTGRYYV